MKCLSLTAIASLLALGTVLACTVESTKRRPSDTEFPVSDDDPPDTTLPPPRIPDITDEDSGAFDLPQRERDGGFDATRGHLDASDVDGSDGGTAVVDAADADAGRLDGGIPREAGDAGDSGIVVPPDACPNPLVAAGDLAVVEILIASASGAGDRAEWVEIQSTRDCSLNLKGTRIESPRGTLKDAVDITTDVWLPPNGIFLVADSADKAVNGGLPGRVFSWAASDSLKNDGDTITVTRGTTTVDTLTYPHLTVYPGRTISFPVDCPWSVRSSWDRWSYSFNAWSTGQKGTPNADNTDVTCY